MLQTVPRPPNPTPSVSWTVRAPKDLHERLATYADGRGRTVNGQLLYWLRWLLDEAEKGNDPHP